MKFFLFILIIFNTFGCKTSSEINPHDLVWGYSGWGVSPNKIQNPVNLSKEEKLEYFYMVAGGKALSRAIEVDSHSFMESTCKISALKDNHDKLITQAILSVNPKFAQDSAFLKKAKDSFFDSKKSELAYCRPTGTGEKYSTCDCVIYINYEGGKEALEKSLQSLK